MGTNSILNKKVKPTLQSFLALKPKEKMMPFNVTIDLTVWQIESLRKSVLTVKRLKYSEFRLCIWLKCWIAKKKAKPKYSTVQTEKKKQSTDFFWKDVIGIL